MINIDFYKKVTSEAAEKGAIVVAVSKFQPIEKIKTLYELGHRDFGENYAQELVDKKELLPGDIKWHFIGHLQSNKVKLIAPFIHLIHGVDNFNLFKAINKEAVKNNRVIDILLQVYIAEEETKFGLDEKELIDLLEYYFAQKEQLANIRICGLMGMASFTADTHKINGEMKRVKELFNLVKQTYFIFDDYFKICSMGMSDDYPIALDNGSTHLRIGSKIFGARS